MHIFPKTGFRENWLWLSSTNCILSCYNISRNPRRANHETEHWIILAQIGCELLPQERIFTKVDQRCVVLTIAYHHAISFQNNCHRADHENHIFFQNCAYSKKRFFWKISWYGYCLTIRPHHDRMFLKTRTKATFVYLYHASSCQKLQKDPQRVNHET